MSFLYLAIVHHNCCHANVHCCLIEHLCLIIGLPYTTLLAALATKLLVSLIKTDGFKWIVGCPLDPRKHSPK